jgi:hypothetical protein
MGRSAARKNNTKNRSALENDANEDRNACSTEFFSSLLGHLSPHFPACVKALETIKPGDIIYVGTAT